MDTRQHDLLELMELRRTAKNGFWRDQYDKGIDKIMRESGAIRSEREELLKAVRGGDKNAMRYYTERIARLRQDETYGRHIS